MAFIIRSIHNGLVLDVRRGEKRSGAEVIMWPYHGGDNQLWEYKNNMIYSKVNGLVLDITGAKNGGQIITFNPHGGKNQKWYFDDDFTIRSDAGMVMDVKKAAKHQGASVIGFGKHGGSNQKFRVIPYSRR
ncbi:endo-1,4-beta-xylanase A-like [Periplaneta americana]|uniref:endo-1,4-beta-xylanase A-like n=1 Tax=Periplaneta americana TaxID=6978 RepID=UPI0037E91997